MNERKPIRRTVQLQPLSREHHDGLLFIWKLRQGLRNGTSIDKLARFTGWYWRQHIRPHFYQEEKVLLPYAPEQFPGVAKMKEEHLEIKELVIAIDRNVDRMDIVDLADLLERHIRFEERELFPMLERQLTPEQLEEIHQGLEKHPVCGTEQWEEEFWLSKRA